ncbi:hypothetical protein AVEN_29259-1 [Araneus ventricosus]|uniref:Uncharacterized protein n=1 Tax=Araneus ventricosus TaxID=182803 RepID=A0A4Y2IPZ6_ARAVE|nr:hypothetical protein AVEN_29259-1 [Araneus ventricosus]
MSMNISVAFGYNGTNLNVRKYGDFIRLLEKSLVSHYSGFICLLHMNEFVRIGKDLEKCEKRPVARFHWNPTRLHEFSVTDETYLFRVIAAVSTGIFPKGLINKPPSKMPGAPRLTCANPNLCFSGISF